MKNKFTTIGVKQEVKDWLVEAIDELGDSSRYHLTVAGLVSRLAYTYHAHVDTSYMEQCKDSKNNHLLIPVNETVYEEYRKLVDTYPTSYMDVLGSAIKNKVVESKQNLDMEIQYAEYIKRKSTQ